MSDLRLAIVGFGLRASLARYAHAPGEGSVVTVVADPAERARSAAAERISGVAVAESLDELLTTYRDRVDAVLVLTPDHLHAEHAVRTLEAGLPTFLEKPLATTIEDADRILAAAARTGTRLYVGHNMRHMPVVRALRERIQAGAIGEVKAVWCRHFVSAGGDYYFKDWHADRRNTTGLLLQKGAHDIDVIHWLTGAFTRSAAAVGQLAVYGDLTDRRDNSDRRMADWYDRDTWPPASQRELHPVIDVEDISMANLVLDGGVLASYQQCHFAPDYWRSYTILGTAGRMENFGDGPGAEVRVWNRRTDAYADPDEIVTVPGESEGHGGADRALMAEFVRYARDGGETETSPIAAREAVAAGVAATESLRGGGGMVDVPALDPAVRASFEPAMPMSGPH
jgi:predicted dehydrogenase